MAAQGHLVMLCLTNAGLTNEDQPQGCVVCLPEVLRTNKKNVKLSTTSAVKCYR